MVTAIAPFAIVLGVATAAGLLFYSFWDRIAQRLSGITSIFATDLERAGLKMQSEQILVGIVGISLSAWLFCTVLLRPELPLAVLLLAGFLFMGFYGFRYWLAGKVKQRAKAFAEQLELVLRMISSGLRVGLGMRQAIVLVTEELPDPVRSEFARVFVQTNLGVSMNDALDMLVGRMPSEELKMMVDAIRVQSQTGGNLAKIMDHLAGTIKGRRAVTRKIKSLTGEAVAGAWVLGALPVLVGGFVMGTQGDMRQVMLTTTVGHIGLTLFFVLELLGIFCLRQLLSFEV
jgi:tight adherence protein B